MKRLQTLKHKFVEFVHEVLEPGILYVSVEYTTAVHKCCCGCGFEVVTPISPSDWKLIFDGKTVSLEPSIGNWGFECQSHYWITRNQVDWAERWSTKRIEAVQRMRRGTEPPAVELAAVPELSATPQAPKKEGVWRRIKGKLKGSKKKSKES
jgi:Family of unknown function (DUF6527)